MIKKIHGIKTWGMQMKKISTIEFIALNIILENKKDLINGLSFYLKT